MNRVFLREFTGYGGLVTLTAAAVMTGYHHSGDRGLISTVTAKEKKSLVVPIKCHDGTTIIPFEVPSRETQLARLQKPDEVFDVLIIGGGATGAGCALDAATRGLNVALVERDDFSAGTSGRSTKLIHGGVRYLEAAFKRLDIGSYRLVNEALEERAHMLTSAPYMNRPLPIMIPIYKWWEVPYMYIGTKVYDFIAGSKRYVPPSYYITPNEATFQFPMLRSEGLKGAIVYYDGQMNDTRMNLMIAFTAAQAGAAICNRVEVVALLKEDSEDDPKCTGVRVRNTLTMEEWDIRAKVVINATGPFADGIRVMDEPDVEPIVVPAAGVHLVLPDHWSPDKMGLLVPKTHDGRVLFFLPWENATLAGTTDSQSDLTMLPCPTETEIDFILAEASRYLNKSVKRSDIRSAWSGIRPLVKDPNVQAGQTSKLSRNHVLEVSSSHLVTIAGGKWTTYRRMAQDTIDRALELLDPSTLTSGHTKSCMTQNMQLMGADRVGQVCGAKFDSIVVTLRETYNLDRDVAEHLMRNYGTRALQIAELAAETGTSVATRLCPKYPYLEAEVVFAVKQEYATKAVDVIARRTRLAYIDSNAASDAVPKIIELMAPLLQWSRARKAQEVKECEVFLQTMHKSN